MNTTKYTISKNLPIPTSSKIHKYNRKLVKLPINRSRTHNMTPYLSDYNLKEFFIPTLDSSGEWRKARVKNANLPFLQFMYNGDKYEPLYCKISNTPGWVNIPDYGTQKDKKRFRIDFNHIRQKCTDSRQSGNSVDKGNRGPSDIFRGSFLDPNTEYKGTERDFERILNVLEFLTIMPVCTEHHSYISQDSAKSDLTLNNFSRSAWIWALQHPDNFNKVKQKLRFNLDYDWMIDHLTNIKHPNIRTRIKNNRSLLS